MKESLTETLHLSFDGKLLISKPLNNAEVDIQQLRKNFEESQKLTDGKKYISLVVLPENIFITREAQMTSKKKEHYAKVVAQAIVVRSQAQRILGNFMAVFSKHPSQNRLFTSKKEALKWLDQQWEKARLN